MVISFGRATQFIFDHIKAFGGQRARPLLISMAILCKFGKVTSLARGNPRNTVWTLEDFFVERERSCQLCMIQSTEWWDFNPLSWMCLSSHWAGLASPKTHTTLHMGIEGPHSVWNMYFWLKCSRRCTLFVEEPRKSKILHSSWYTEMWAPKTYKSFYFRVFCS